MSRSLTRHKGALPVAAQRVLKALVPVNAYRQKVPNRRGHGGKVRSCPCLTEPLAIGPFEVSELLVDIKRH